MHNQEFIRVINNPFLLLGVTTRDNRRRIVELAEEKSLELDHDACQKARSDLTNPRVRLSVEMAWLPGVSPGKSLQLIARLHSEPMSVRSEYGLPTLAHLNLLAVAVESIGVDESPKNIAEFIQDMARLADQLSSNEILRDINEDRSVSGFPEVKGLDQIESGLLERKRYYRKAIKDMLNRLPGGSLVDSMIAAVDGATSGGQGHAPELIDDLVDSYAVETQGFLRDEAKNVEKLIDAARNSANLGELSIKPIIDKLMLVAGNWDNVAQPIQLSAMARGMDHQPSLEIAFLIRSLAIDLFNDHDMLHQSQRLTDLIQKLFEELPEFVERVKQDSEELENISSGRKKLEQQFKEFDLEGNEFSYRKKKYKVDEICHISFSRAVTTHKTNYVKTGETEKVSMGLTFFNGSTVNISMDEEGFFFNGNKSVEIIKIVEFYTYLSHVTFEIRLAKYESEIDKNDFFVYDDCHFYPNDKIVFRGKDFYMNSTSFLRSYGNIEMRKKDFGFLDKVKREVTFTKIPQFSTIVDTDIIFYILDKHFSLRWGK